MSPRIKLCFAASIAILIGAFSNWHKTTDSLSRRTDESHNLRSNERRNTNSRESRHNSSTASPQRSHEKSPEEEPTPPRNRHEEEERGELESLTLLKSHLSLEDLKSNLFALRNRLSFIAFSKTMRQLAASPLYSADEKAAAFNEFLPYEIVTQGPSVVPVYNDVALDWGILPENRDQFFAFTENIDSPEIQKLLASAYLQANFSEPKQFSELVVTESNLKNPSYLGKDQVERIERLSWLIDSMISGKRATAPELTDIVSSLDIENDFKSSLLNAIRLKDHP